MFNRPADKGAIDALRAAPSVPNLTDTLQGLSEATWRQVLAKLRRARLLVESNPNQPEKLDTHPLIRDHYRQQLKRTRHEAWQEGNNRLYEYLKSTAKELPDTIEEMTPLFEAVAHGCNANRYLDALNEVYGRRIQRGDKGYSMKKLGAFSADLEALSSFFDRPWNQLVDGLPTVTKSYILHQVGLDLQALGRLAEAVQPMREALDVRVRQKFWGGAARSANNLSEHYLMMGNIAEAISHARQSVDLADRAAKAFSRGDLLRLVSLRAWVDIWRAARSYSKSIKKRKRSLVGTLRQLRVSRREILAENLHVRIVSRATLGDALHQAGRLTEAEIIFREAEEMEKKGDRNYTFLYSVPGFQYCDLLLGQGKYKEVQDRAMYTLEIAERQGASSLTFALGSLSLGHAHLLQTQIEDTGDFIQATNHLRQAVSELREAAMEGFIAPGLIARADLHQVTHDLEAAQVDLDEALSIVTRYGMGLHEADCHLAYARLNIDRGETEQARSNLAIAEEIIGRLGYHRRDNQFKELKQQIRVKDRTGH